MDYRLFSYKKHGLKCFVALCSLIWVLRGLCSCPYWIAVSQKSMAMTTPIQDRCKIAAQAKAASMSLASEAGVSCGA